MGRGFEGGLEDVVGSATNAATKAFTNSAKFTGQQIGLGNNASSAANAEGSAFEGNQQIAQQLPQGKQNKTSTDPAQVQQQSLAEQQKIAQVRQQLHQQHMRTYFIPTFQEKPAKIKQEREQKWQQANQEKEQEKKQMDFMQEEKKKEYQQISLDKKAKGEIGKVGSG